MRFRRACELLLVSMVGEEWERERERQGQERTLSVQGQHRLYSHIDAAEVVSFKHDFAHLLSVFERVHRWLGQEDLAPRGADFHLFVKCVVPEVRHVVPVFHDAVFHLF